MPIFEYDEEITHKEFHRQQKQLNDKIFRKTFKEMMEEFNNQGFNGGDCWKKEENK